LAQAVLIIGYEMFKNLNTAQAVRLPTGKSDMASKRETEYLFRHLEDALDAAGYFKVPEKKPRMVRNIRNALSRMEMTAQEVRTLHGMIEDLAHLPSAK
jgi:tRNA/rRNA methyltransferase